MKLDPAIRAVVRRIRAQRAADLGTLFAAVALAWIACIVALERTGQLPASHACVCKTATLALPLLAVFLGLLRPVSKLRAAQLLDRSHDLRSRIASALELRSAGPTSAFSRAAIEDGENAATRTSPARALPLRRPRGWPSACGTALAALLLASLELPLTATTAARAPERPRRMLHDDDIDAFRQPLEELLRTPETRTDVREIAGRMNAIIERIADSSLDRTDALRELAALERTLEEGRRVDAESLLSELARALRRAGPTRPASEALARGDLGSAATAVRDLARAVADHSLRDASLRELRDALSRGATSLEGNNENSRRIEALRRERERLLRRRAENPQDQASERLLRRRERELEQLERDEARNEERRRELERLRRQMQQAAEGLGQQDSSSADALEQAAEELNRMSQDERSDEQRQALEQQLRDLREQLRRLGVEGTGSGGQGQGREGRMERFVLDARGGGQAGSLRLAVPQGGQPGGGQPGGQSGQGGQNGQNTPQGQQTLTLGQGGNAVLELPGGARSTSRPTSGGGVGGSEAGVGHDSTRAEDPTRLGGAHADLGVGGQRSRGPSRSETILGAADQGFATSDYQRVYNDYRDHAEEVIETDTIPDGYRFYVRRYFQLIRPRTQFGGNSP